MAGLETAAAIIGIADVTGKVLKAGFTILQDTKSYGIDAKKVALQFEQSSHRYNSLSRVLFDKQKFPFLGGQALFEQLTEHTKNLVLELFLELLRVLYNFFSLEQKYTSLTSGAKSSHAMYNHLGLTVEEEKLIFTGTPAAQDIRVHKSRLFTMANSWSWGFAGKRKAVRTVAEFDAWLKHTKSIVEDTWWPLPAFTALTHFDILTGDVDAKVSGVAATAKLRKLMLEQSSLPQSLEVSWSSVKITGSLPPSKELGILQDSYVLTETLVFRADEYGDLPDILAQRFSKIISLLNSQRDPDFRVLKCLKYSKQISESRVELRLISEISAASSQPTLRSLLSLYSGIGPGKGALRPPLGVRFRICHDLAESIFLLHSVDWVHRAIRSENIIFVFTSDDIDRATFGKAQLRLCGFEAARPAKDASLGPYDNQLARNVYRHPQRWGTPKENFSRVHDIYSLGVIMLELGLWTTAESMLQGLKDVDKVAEKVHMHLLRQVDERLAYHCGEQFANVVRRCLTSRFEENQHKDEDNTISGPEEQQLVHTGLLFQIIQPLKRLVDVV